MAFYGTTTPKYKECPVYISLNSELETIQEIVAQGKQFIEQFGTCNDFSESQKKLYKIIFEDIIKTSFKLEKIFEKYAKSERLSHADAYYFSRDYEDERAGVWCDIGYWLIDDDINVPPNDDFIKACEEMKKALERIGSLLCKKNVPFAMCRLIYRISPDDYLDIVDAQLKGQAQRV